MAKKKHKTDPPTNVGGYDPTRDAGDCTWDQAAADHIVEFFPGLLTHVKGFSGKFALQPWQKDWLGTLFGWRRPDGTRRYRECLAAVPRKNGKTAIAAGLSLYLLMCDHEPGAEVYSAAYSVEQASLVFGPAAAMVRQSPTLGKHCRIIDTQKRIVHQTSGSFYRAIPAESANSHGFNGHAVLFDELHTQPNRLLYDVLKTSQGARRNPLFLSITTAGYDRHSICWEVWNYARQVRDGVVRDPYFLPVIYEIADGEDWQSEDVWRRVNPNLGVSLSREYLDEAFRRAKEIPAYENTFRNLHCNQWTEQAVRWLPLDKWDACGSEPSYLVGADCWGGLDLSTTTDISALVLAFQVDDRRELICKFWVPEESARIRAHRDRVPYPQWISEGWITATPGNSIDYECIRRDIHALADQYRIRQIAIDRWNATQLAGQLGGDGLDVGMFGQGFASMSSPAKELERLVVDGRLRHGNNPVLRWMAANAAIEQDAAGNIKPSKAKSTERIDGIVATIMALGSMALSPAAPSGSLFVC